LIFERSAERSSQKSTTLLKHNHCIYSLTVTCGLTQQNQHQDHLPRRFDHATGRLKLPESG
jgi:hypothetical protein